MQIPIQRRIQMLETLEDEIREGISEVAHHDAKLAESMASGDGNEMPIMAAHRKASSDLQGRITCFEVCRSIAELQLQHEVAKTNARG